MSKKLVWPLAKKREDGCPAIWLSHGVWDAVCGGLINFYLNNRQSRGRSEARIAIGKRDDILDSWRTDERGAENALTVYRIGFEANASPKSVAQYPDLYTTPAQLIALGDKAEARAFEEELASHFEGPRVTRDKSGNAYCEIKGEFHPIAGGRPKYGWEVRAV